MTRRIITDELLDTLVANAKRASQSDPGLGDGWRRSHDVVISGDGRNSIAMPSFIEKHSLHGCPPVQTAGFSTNVCRHIAGADPATVIALAQEIQRLRDQLSDEKKWELKWVPEMEPVYAKDGWEMTHVMRGTPGTPDRERLLMKRIGS